MKKIYQVESKLKRGNGEWLEDHLPFDSKEEAENYIKTQYKNTHEYRIIVDKVPETIEEEFYLMDEILKEIGYDRPSLSS